MNRIPLLCCYLLLASLLFAVPLVGQKRSGYEKNREEESADINQKRSEWFYGQRAYPHKYVPSGAYLSALAQRDNLVAQQFAEQGAAQPMWKSIGPQPVHNPFADPTVTGRVSAIAINPSNVNIIYVGGAQGGVWKSTDAGRTFKPLTDNQASTATGSITLDPTNPNIVYVGTGEENFSGDSYYGAGILKSTDGGTTWSHYCGPFCGPIGQDGYYGGGGRIGSLAIDPQNNEIVLAAAQLLFEDGIYRSTDGGQHWTQVLAGAPGDAVMFDPSGSVAYASLGDIFEGETEGVYKSIDGGITWTPDNGSGANTLPLANAGRIVLAMAPSAPTTIYAGIDNVFDGTLLGVFKTTDGGNNWVQLTTAPDYCTPQCGYDNVIAVHPTNPNVVFAGGAFSTTLIRSLDGGQSWSILQSAQNFGQLHADVHALTFTPDGSRFYVGNDGGAYVTTQPLAQAPNFTSLSNTLSLVQFYPGLSIHPTNPAIAIGGTQDNGTEMFSGVLKWNNVTCGDGGYTAIDFVVPSTIYATCQNIDIQKSTMSGAVGTWFEHSGGIDQSDKVDFIPPLVMDPSQSSTLYFGTYRVYQTTGGANSWAAISPDLTNDDPFWGVLTTMAVAPTDSNTVYAGSGDSNVETTRNAGSGTSATWTKIASGLPPRVITQLAVDPKIATKAYVTFSGFTGFGDNLGHVFRTTNAGSTWTDITTNLPNTPVNSIVIHPTMTNIIFVGTDVGVFYTTTGGGSWSPLVNGLPRVAVLGLNYHRASKILRASTHGRGVWDIQLPVLP
jgi:photosystem II stability/assembly factor-like uncharacterized protein